LRVLDNTRAAGFELMTLRASAAVETCAYSPDGRRLVSASHDATLKIWDVRRERLVRTLEGHAEPVFACMFSPDSRRDHHRSKSRVSQDRFRRREAPPPAAPDRRL